MVPTVNPVRSDGARGRRLLVALALAVGLAGVAWTGWDMFGAARRPMLQGWDDSFYYYWLPAVVIHHNVDFAPLLRDSGTVDAAAREAGLAQSQTAAHLLPSKFPPGWALGSLPFFLAAWPFAPPHPTGFEPCFLAAVWCGQLLYAVAGLWLGVDLVRRLVPGAPALVAVLSVWLASPLVYYQSARLSMSHSQVFVLAILTFWLARRLVEGDHRARVYFALGFAGALLVVTRNSAAVYLLFPALAVGRTLRSPGAAAWLLAGAALPAAVQLAAWKALFGTWLTYSYGSEGFDFRHPHLAAVLFSPLHGWFYWHPLLLPAIAGFVVWSLRNRLALPWLGSLVLVVGINGAWWCWWFGSSFGNRAFEAATFFAMLGLAFLLRVAGPRRLWRTALAAAVALAVAANLVLLALFLARRIPRDAPVTYRQGAAALARWVGIAE